MAEARRPHTVLVIDVEGFGLLADSDRKQVLVRQRLHRALQRTLAAIGVEPEQVLALTDLGDGALVVLDHTVASGRLLGMGIAELVAALADDDHPLGPANSQLRLRVAVHHGPLVRDAHGYTGQTLTLAFRLLDAELGRVVLGTVPTAALVVLASEAAYQDLLTSGDVTADLFEPVWVAHKETTTRAWLYLPGVRPQPRVGQLLRAAGSLRTISDSEKGADTVRRREALALSGTLMGGATLELLVADRRVDVADGLAAERVARRLHQLAESMPARRVDGALQRHADAVDRLARRTVNPRARAALLRALVQTQSYGGFVAAFDLGDQRKAQGRFRVALRAADQLGDPVLAALVCFRMSGAARSAGRFTEALELARTGAGLVDRADPALRAALQLATAHAHDRLGQDTEALRALEIGQALVDDPKLPRSPWTRVDAVRFAGGRGTVEAGLGRLDLAAAALTTTIEAYPPGNGHRGLLLAHLAKVHFAQEAPERAIVLATEALGVARSLGSRHRLAALGMLWPDLRRYRHLAVARELADQLRAPKASAAVRDRHRREATPPT
jgi:tetratricopeptide (TPR) repeat protein